MSVYIYLFFLIFRDAFQRQNCDEVIELQNRQYFDRND